jgi:hypothetical protein
MKFRLLCFLTLLGFSLSGYAQKTPSDKVDSEGQELAAELRAQQPKDRTTVSGVLKILSGKGKATEIPVTSEVIPGETRWQVIYQTPETNGQPSVRLVVTHVDQQPNEYELTEIRGGTNGIPKTVKLAGDQAMIPFAGSDFWLADLGLEFFHWPDQKLLRKEMKRSRSSRVLESHNPKPAASGYVRVLSWIDKDSDGIVQAEAYDAQNKLLKSFLPKDLEKVDGQYQLKRMDIRNEQTGSRTILEFDFDKK